jgi:hypothetical protein
VEFAIDIEPQSPRVVKIHDITTIKSIAIHVRYSSSQLLKGIIITDERDYYRDPYYKLKEQIKLLGIEEVNQL